MSSKPATCVVALLLPDGTIDYRMRDDDIAGVLSHPDTRVGVLVFYGYYGKQHTVRPPGPVCPTCGVATPKVIASWDLRITRPPVFVCQEGAFIVKREKVTRRREVVGPWGNWADTIEEYEYKITQQRATNILIDKRRIDWIINEWMEKYV